MVYYFHGDFPSQTITLQEKITYVEKLPFVDHFPRETLGFHIYVSLP